MSTLTSVVTVLGTEDTTFVYTFTNLKLKANEDTTTLGFKIAALTSGTLWYGVDEVTATQITTVTSNYIFSAGGMSVGGAAAVAANLYWKPSLNASGVTNGFSIKASASAIANTTLSTTNVAVNFDLAAVNDAPVINSVSNMLDAVAGTAKTFLGSDLITHISATDVEGSTLSYKITAISNGTLTVNGSAVTTPYTILSTDSFSWTSTTTGTVAAFSIVANDGLLDSVLPATSVNFVVSPPPNSIPQLVGATLSTTILETQTTTPFSSMIIADADSGQTVGATITLSAANGTLSGIGLTGNAINGYSLSAVSPADLTTAIKALVFTPTIIAADGAGTKITTFTVTATDSFAYGAGTVTNSQTVVAITTLNDAPTSSGLNVTTFEDTSKTFTVADFNYVDAESTSLATVQLFALPAVGALKYNNVAATLNQEILSSNLGLLTFTPALNANGSNYATFQYKVSDGNLYSAAATATINVTAVDDAPVGVDDVNSAVKTLTMTGNVLTNDADVDVGTTKTVSAISSTPVSSSPVSVAGTYGNLTINADGSYSYLADATKALIIALKSNMTPLTDTFTYTVSDGALTSTAHLTLTIQGSANNVPVTTATAIAIGEDASVAATGTLSAIDSDGDTLLIKAHTGLSLTFTSDTAITTPLTLVGTYGTLTLNSTKAYSYAIDTTQTQLLAQGVTATDNFTYQVDDSKGGYSTALIGVTITGANDAPVAIADSLIATNEDTARTYTAANLLSNDTDVDTAHSALSIESVANGTGGTVVLNSDGTVTFTPTLNFNGAANFTYIATDGLTDSSAATASLTVNAVNNAPMLAISAHELTFASAFSAQTVSGISITEVDGEVITATVDVIAGTLSATAAANLTITGNASSLLTLRGLASIVNTALTTLKYTQAGNSDDSLIVSVQDSASPNLKADNQVVSLIIGGNDNYPNTPDGFNFSANSSISYPSEPLFISNYGANAVGVSQTVSPSSVVLTANSHTLTLTSCPTVLDGSKIQFSDGSKLSVNTGSATSLYGGYNANGDQLVAGSAGDILFGYDGGDLLIGGAWLDKFYAGNGNDTVVGNGGNDIIVGGAGNDYFVYHTASGSSEGTDIILDFVKNTDKIALTSDNVINTTSTPAATGFTITANGGNTTITLTGTTTTILVNGVIGMTASDFVLV